MYINVFLRFSNKLKWMLFDANLLIVNKFLEKNFDYVLIDTGAGLSKNITNFILSSDETIILKTPEPHAITDAYSIIKVILEKSKDVTLKLAINKCENNKEGETVLNFRFRE